MPLVEVAALAAVRNDGRAANRATGHDIVSGTARKGGRQEEIKGREEGDGEREGERNETK